MEMKTYSILIVDHDDKQANVGGSIEVTLDATPINVLDCLFWAMKDCKTFPIWRKLERFPETDEAGNCTPGQRFGDDE